MNVIVFTGSNRGSSLFRAAARRDLTGSFASLRMSVDAEGVSKLEMRKKINDRAYVFGSTHNWALRVFDSGDDLDAPSHTAC